MQYRRGIWGLTSGENTAWNSVLQHRPSASLVGQQWPGCPYNPFRVGYIWASRVTGVTWQICWDAGPLVGSSGLPFRGYSTKFGWGCAARERQNPPISKGTLKDQTSPMPKEFIPRGDTSVWSPPHPLPISYRHPCSASCYSNLQMVIALPRKYIQCQLPRLSILANHNR